MSRPSSVSLAVPAFVPIAIPAPEAFLKKWHAWIFSKVVRHFKRDKERCQDTAQNVRLRLLSKNFIARWFFKHLTDELVDKKQAELMLGGVPLAYIGAVHPVYGHRSNRDGINEKTGQPYDTSIWRVSELLAFARFDYERYFYSVQGHTIDSEKVLRLLGYGPTEFSVLESLYRQGKLKPAELTEHQCQEIIRPIERRNGNCGIEGCGRKHYSLGYCSNHYHLSRERECSECDHGRDLLRARGISLSHRWNNPEVSDAVRKLRWNDSQLRKYLREWRKDNLVSKTPEYIMRRDPKQGIDAGLLKYAEMVIDHEVVNDFKRMGRAEDLTNVVLNNGMGPEFSDKETVAWDSDDKEHDDPSAIQRVIRDGSALGKFYQVEGWHDVQRLVESAELSDEEMEAIVSVDLGDLSVRQYSEKHEIPVQRVHRILQSAHKKLASKDLPHVVTDEMAERTATKYGCSVADICGPSLFGACVNARTELFSTLFDTGMTIPGISARFGISEEKVSAAINRAVLRESRAG